MSKETQLEAFIARRTKARSLRLAVAALSDDDLRSRLEGAVRADGALQMADLNDARISDPGCQASVEAMDRQFMQAMERQAQIKMLRDDSDARRMKALVAKVLTDASMGGLSLNSPEVTAVLTHLQKVEQDRADVINALDDLLTEVMPEIFDWPLPAARAVIRADGVLSRLR